MIGPEGRLRPSAIPWILTDASADGARCRSPASGRTSPRTRSHLTPPSWPTVMRIPGPLLAQGSSSIIGHESGDDASAINLYQHPSGLDRRSTARRHRSYNRCSWTNRPQEPVRLAPTTMKPSIVILGPSHRNPGIHNRRRERTKRNAGRCLRPRRRLWIPGSRRRRAPG